MEQVNKEEIKKELQKLFYEKLEDLNKDWKMPYVKELEPGLWEIFDGENTIHTNNEGKKTFDEALRKAFEEIDNKDEKSLNE